MQPRHIPVLDDPTQRRSRLAQEYLDAKRFADSTAKRVSELKSALINDLDTNGIADDRGHVWCPAGDLTLKKERRVSESFDLAAATKWAKEIGVWDDVKEVVEVTTEDRILALGWKRPELTPALEQFYSINETWAFKVVEGQAKGLVDDE